VNICVDSTPLAGRATRPAWALLLVSLLFLGACASAPPPAPVSAPAPAQPSLAELMKQAQDAHAQGGKERARETWREASRNYPTSKEPWLKLAEDHFATADYGYAVLAAQEVSQRDPADRTAHSILAVAGLRVAAMALGALRGQQSGMPADTRSEAENLTKLLRETLGEPVLVPADSVAQPARRPAPRRAAAEPAAKPADAKPAPDSRLAELARPAPKAEPLKPETPKAEPPKPAAQPSKPAATPPGAANPFDRLR